MVVKRDTPLLPVHSMRDPKKRFRRKGACMRLVIMAAVLFCIGYAVFATRYIGTSKERRTARDNLIKSQLEKSRLANTMNAGAHREGRSLKEEAYSPNINIHERTPHRHIQSPQPRRHLEISPETFPGTDEALYDAVVANDGSDRHDLRHQQQAHVAPQTKHITHEAGRDDHTVRAPHSAPQTHHEEQQGHRISQQTVTAERRSVVAGPGEVDREAELKRDSAATSPSLAIGSRIEADNHVAAPKVVEPGASPVVYTPKEPTSERPVQAQAPITVTQLEPDSHQAKQQPDVHAPIITQAPHETDSIAGTGAQHKAPEDVPVVSKPVGDSSTASGGVTTTSTTVAPVVHGAVVPPPTPALVPPTTNPFAKGLYALEAKDIDGNTRSLSEFAGKVTIVVNVASACGYTDDNYKGLMKTYEKYRPHGLEILGFPCNQFGSQESGTEAEIKSFCSSRYHVDWPMFSKVDVNGPNTHPVYQFLKRELPESEGGGGGKGPGSDLVWNFQKIIVNHEGRPVKRIYQAWDQGAVEHEVYQLLHDARHATAAGAAVSH